ncbi:hypothetical protein FQN54_002273 [Arachnomyces sp. PD_36]|nr:hypothetical protein FQN54_002273 [Arachnomyces sp. PD_36]
MFGLTALALVAQSAAALASLQIPPKPYGFFVNSTIYQPVGNESITYPRFTELQDGTIIATASYRGPEPAYFPVFESDDGGASWRWISDIKDQVNGWGFPAQPALMELTEPLAGFQPGTIFASGNSWSNSTTDNGTRIDLYASTDRARSWDFVSHIAEGAPPNTTNGHHPIWEPYLLTYDNSLVCFYSDQRDSGTPSNPKGHGQKLVHQVSKDLIHWDDPVEDVAYDQYIARPGMTVVEYIPPLEKWILVHELPVGNSSSHGANYPVYYVLADSPLEFRHSEGIPIVINNQTAPNASPYVTWTPIGGLNGTIIVSDADNPQVYTNSFGGDPDKWEELWTPAGATYSRAIHVLNKHPDHLLIFGGETYDGMDLGLLTPFAATVVKLG